MKKVEVTRIKLMALSLAVIDKVMERNAAYQDAWQHQGICGVLSRLCDKMIRVENWQGKEVIIQGEDTEDDLIDSIGYSMLGLLYLKEPVIEEAVEELIEIFIDEIGTWAAFNDMTILKEEIEENQ